MKLELVAKVMKLSIPLHVQFLLFNHIFFFYLSVLKAQREKGAETIVRLPPH